MSFGIFTGTFSSIYIAAPVLLWIEKRWPGEDATRRAGVRSAPGGDPAGVRTAGDAVVSVCPHPQPAR